MNRTEARTFMMQVLYQMDIRKDRDPAGADQYLKRGKIDTQEAYCRSVHRLYCEKKEEIDGLIDRFSRNWEIKRMPRTDIAVLRLAVIEILYMEDIPEAVSANEAVKLGKKFGTEDSPRFINAVLGSIIRDHQKGE